MVTAAQKAEYDNKAVVGNLAATARNFNGLNEGKDNLDVYVGAGDGVAWCGSYVKKMFELSGFGGALSGLTNDQAKSVSNYVEFGKKNNLMSKFDENTKIREGDIMTFGGGTKHIMVVTKVYPDGSFEGSQGNTTNRVQTLKYTPDDIKSGKIDSAYLSAEKLDARNKQVTNNPNAPTLGKPSQQQPETEQDKIISKLPTYTEAETAVKKNGAVNSYETFAQIFGYNKQKPEETDKNSTAKMALGMLAALLILASGQENIQLAPDANEQQRRESLGLVDKQMGINVPMQQPTTQPTVPAIPIQVENVSVNSPPASTPKAPVMAGNTMGKSNWL
jgi:hypothetical protein